MIRPPDHFLLICQTCRGAFSADDLRAAIADRLPARFGIRTVACMAGCAHPVTVGFQGRGKAQYLFGRIGSDADVDALAAFAAQYAESGDGWTNSTERPPALRHKTLSRLPALDAEAGT